MLEVQIDDIDPLRVDTARWSERNVPAVHQPDD
jgi:hypothetical protein